jgi:hypothetical protein
MSPFSGPLVLRTRDGAEVASAEAREEDEASLPMIIRDHRNGTRMWAPMSLLARLARRATAIELPDEPLVLRYEGSSVELLPAAARRMFEAVDNLDSTFGSNGKAASDEPAAAASPEPVDDSSPKGA